MTTQSMYITIFTLLEYNLTFILLLLPRRYWYPLGFKYRVHSPMPTYFLVRRLNLILVRYIFAMIINYQFVKRVTS